MACLELEPELTGWKVQINPLSYDGSPSHIFCIKYLLTLKRGKILKGFRL